MHWFKRLSGAFAPPEVEQLPPPRKKISHRVFTDACATIGLVGRSAIEIAAETGNAEQKAFIALNRPRYDDAMLVLLAYVEGRCLDADAENVRTYLSDEQNSAKDTP